MFNKVKFAKILKDINETYGSQRDFSKKSTINRTYLSQYINMKLDEPPKPKTLERLANNSNGIVSYNELMEICGYIDNNYFIELQQLKDKLEKTEKYYTDKLNKYRLSKNENQIYSDLMGIIKIHKFKDYSNVDIDSELNSYFDNMDYININSKNKILNKIKLFIEYYTETYKINKNIVDLKYLNSQDERIASKKMLSSLDNKHEVTTNLPSSALVFVYGTIPAGIPMECIDDIIDTEEISADMLKGGKQYFGLKIKGNSMYPEYLDGDTIILEKVDNCENGQDCVVMVNGNDGTFKRVFKNENGIILQPLNNEFQPMVYSNEQIKNLPVRVIGKVVELRRKK